MKIIHCSDLHLDADLRTKYDAASAAERRAELLDTFRRLCRYAREEAVSAVLICGDLFDTASPSSSAVRTVEDLIIANSDLLFFYLRGNHDERPALFRTRRGPENLCLFGDDWTTWELSEDRDQGRRICITGREPSNAVLTSPELDPSCINIVMLHGQVREGYTAPDPESVPLSALRFDECGNCGFILLEIDEAQSHITPRFIPFASRRIYSVECPVTGCASDTEVYERISRVLSASPASDADLVRLALTGELEYGCSPDPALIQREWEGRYHYFEYRNYARPVVHSEDFLCDATLKGEFVRAVSAADGLDDAERTMILRCGLRALSGESLF